MIELAIKILEYLNRDYSVNHNMDDFAISLGENYNEEKLHLSLKYLRDKEFIENSFPDEVVFSNLIYNSYTDTTSIDYKKQMYSKNFPGLYKITFNGIEYLEEKSIK